MIKIQRKLLNLHIGRTNHFWTLINLNIKKQSLEKSHYI